MIASESGVCYESLKKKYASSRQKSISIKVTRSQKYSLPRTDPIYGHVGQEGVSLIRAAVETGNPVLASTALISLHRLSEKTPELIKPEDVKQYAETHKTSQDQRLKATASAILLEAK